MCRCINCRHFVTESNTGRCSEQLSVRRPYFSFCCLLDDSADDTDGDSSEVERLAEKLYGLIHARFILTNRGVSMMLQKWRNGDFGNCPRVLCFEHPLLPMGTVDLPGKDTVKMFCTSCSDIYFPKHARHQAIDGAYFGTSFPEMFLMMYPEYRRPKPQRFVPRLFGFKIRQEPGDTEDQRA